jgi:NADH:ubiquinone oxidoreductase subunit 3 (subunit A)
MANKKGLWRNPNWPFKQSYPLRILIYVVLDLAIVNVLVFCVAYKLPLTMVVPVIVIEIVALAAALWFWAPAYKLKF